MMEYWNDENPERRLRNLNPQPAEPLRPWQKNSRSASEEKWRMAKKSQTAEVAMDS
jgi:hypothetical protein